MHCADCDFGRGLKTKWGQQTQHVPLFAACNSNTSCSHTRCPKRVENTLKILNLAIFLKTFSAIRLPPFVPTTKAPPTIWPTSMLNKIQVQLHLRHPNTCSNKRYITAHCLRHWTCMHGSSESCLAHQPQILQTPLCNQDNSKKLRGVLKYFTRIVKGAFKLQHKIPLMSTQRKYPNGISTCTRLRIATVA